MLRQRCTRAWTWPWFRDLTDSVVRAPQHRQRIGRVFAFLVRRLTGLPFKDTQCGFKLMPTDTAVTLLGSTT